ENKYDQAIQYYENALKHGLNDPKSTQINAANSHNNLGDSYNNNRQYNKAIGHHRKALKIRLDIFGTNHADVARSYYNNKQYNKAIEYYEKALKIRLYIFGINQLDVANSCNNLGLSYDNNGQMKTALKYYEE
ncbi:hypothetical protein RFI_39236, partial [Reticulomyxa filosa]